MRAQYCLLTLVPSTKCLAMKQLLFYNLYLSVQPPHILNSFLLEAFFSFLLSLNQEWLFVKHKSESAQVPTHFRKNNMKWHFFFKCLMCCSKKGNFTWGEDSGRRANSIFSWRKKTTLGKWETLQSKLLLQASGNKTKSCVVALLKFGSEMGK